MKVRSSAGLVLGALLAVSFSTLTAQGAKNQAPDPLSGSWNVTFMVPGYPPTPAVFEFAVEDGKVTGTVRSDHTGTGKVTEGSWKDGKLSFVAVFDQHESIAITGTIENGKLAGEFRTEGFTAKWEGSKAP